MCQGLFASHIRYCTLDIAHAHSRQARGQRSWGFSLHSEIQYILGVLSELCEVTPLAFWLVLSEVAVIAVSTAH